MGGDSVYHNCSYCADRFSLSVALLMHKVQCHSYDFNGKPNSFDTFIAELIKDETKYSSDCIFNYTINITTSVTQTVKDGLVKREPLIEMIPDDTINMDISEPTKLGQMVALPTEILSNPKKFFCRLCGLEKSKKNIQRHMRTVHKTEIDPDFESSLTQAVSNEEEPIFEEIDIKDPLIPETCMFSLDENPTNIEYDKIVPLSVEIQSFERPSLECEVRRKRIRSRESCPVCGVEMLKTSVGRHLRRVHKMNNKFCPDRISRTGERNDSSVVSNLPGIHKANNIFPDKKPRTDELNASQEKCPICQRAIFIRNLKVHLIQVHEVPESLIKDVNLRTSFKCLKCLEVHPRSELEVHFMKSHNIVCSTEVRSLHVTADLPEIISLETSPLKRFKPRCPICKRGILRRNMRGHLISVHELNDFDLKANLSLTNLRSESNWVISKCTRCEYNGTTVALRLHDKIKHSVERTISLLKLNEENEPIPLIYRKGKRGYNCALCQYDDNTRLSMLEHLLSDHLETINQLTGVHFDCDICPKVVKSFTDFEAHQNKHIYKLGLDQFFCDYCGVFKRTKTDLKTHMLAHLNLRNFICDICQKGFNNKHTISDHMITHSNEKSHICNVDGCVAKYRRKEKLLEHKQVRHGTKQYHYQCEICGKKFPLKSYLRLHKYVHVREFKCRTCDAIFPSRQHLRKHRAKNCKAYII